ncbi:hypothetical protein [Marilutibacter spongiae]|uniref:Transcriptional regulator SutA RNAP-binding domain-containing protein n=1 Tax=Marilutibacter spongiae TaxID=2025720 RepID=A0A7W3TP61_9GAMM|nr:hypothetical protein [Lysobacter spongiae]MBB1061915.1 hypothetical protein [Lysobacter spongiae]
MTTGKPTTAGRVRTFIAGRANGATTREVHRFLVGEGPSRTTSSMLATMVKHGKLDKRGNRFFTNAASFVDRRSGMTVATPKPEPKRVALALRAGEVAASTRAAPNRLQTSLAAPLATVRDAAPTVATMCSAVEVKKPLRDTLARDVDAFLARGGRVQTFAMGETAHSIAERERQAQAFRRERSEIHPTKRGKRAA